MSAFLLRRAWRQLGLSLAILGAFAALGGTLTANVLVAQNAHDAAIRAAIAGGGDNVMLQVSRGVARSAGPVTIDALIAGLDAFEGETTAEVRSSLRDMLEPSPAELRIAGLLSSGPTGGPATAITVRGIRGTIPSLIRGRAPQVAVGDLEASLDERAATRLGVALGDVICPFVPEDRAQSFCVRIVGVVRAGADQSEATIWAPVPTVFTMMLALPTGRSLEQVVFRPTVADFAASDAGWVIPAVRALRTRLNTRGLVVTTYLDAVIDHAESQWSASASALLVVAAITTLLGVFAAAVVIGTVDRRQRDAVRLWHMRGWGRRRLLSLRALQFAITASIALPLGLAIGTTAFRSLTGEPFPRDLVQTLAVATFISSIGLIIAVIAGVLLLRRNAHTPRSSRARARLSGALLASGAAAITAAFLRTRSDSSDPSRSTEDLFLIATGAAAVGAALLQLLPRITSRFGRLGIVGTLARAQLVRDFEQHARFATLIVFALATMTFALAFASTAARAGEDRAAFWAGSERRWALDSSLKPDFGAPSTDRSVEVMRWYAHAGGLTDEIQMLAVPAGWADVTWWRPDFATRGPAQLVAALARGETGDVLLSDAEVHLWALASGAVAHVELVGTDSVGVRCVADLGDYRGGAWEQHAAQLACDRAPVLPVLVRRLDVRTTQASANAHLTLSDLTSVGPSGAITIAAFDRENRDVRTDGGRSAWWYTDPRTGALVDLTRASSAVPRNGRLTVTLDVASTDSAFYIGAPVPGQQLHALASPGLLARLGVEEGQQFELSIGRSTLSVAVIEQVSGFPTMYRGLGEYLVLPLESTTLAMARQGGDQAWPNEIWASNTTDTPPDHVGAMFDRAALTAATEAEPLHRALTQLLSLGALAALVIAALAAALHFAVVLGGRRSLDAILEAQGASRRSLRASHMLEQAWLLIYSSALGALLGLGAALIVIPTLRLGVTLQDTEPRALVQLPPAEAGLILLAVAALIALGNSLVRLRRERALAEELRAL